MSDESPKLPPQKRISEESTDSPGSGAQVGRRALDSNSETSAVSSSVLQRVQSQTRRRRSRPPAWAIALTQRLQQFRRFLRTRLPAGLKKRRQEIVIVLISILMHVMLGLLFAAWLMPASVQGDLLTLLGVPVEPADDSIRPEELVEIVQPDSLQDLHVDSTMQQMLAELDNGVHRMQMESQDIKDVTLPLEDLTEVPEIPFIKGDFGGRSESGRQAAVRKYGGNAESERAVNFGLTWLQKIQQPDGSWNFAEVGEAGQRGSLQATTMGATSMAMLTFLGGGHTHRSKGQFQETVNKGLAYLLSKAEQTSSGLDLRGTAQGNSGMYVQGLATICLCEASAMEPGDRVLRRAATGAIKFIEKAQDHQGGGWRYRPNEPGDTSVTGWQIMALQSAKTCRISVDGDTFRGAREFLKSASVNNGSMYSYVARGGPTDTMTAVGLLCQMYLGWQRDRPELKAGVEHLSKVGPSRENIYYNYYASQVLHHWGGELWDQWNLRMRNQLVSTQVQDGPGAGSWNVTDPHGDSGGRIYQTALSIMTLEIYYRHLPIYRRFDEKSGRSDK
ncbi:MAG: prenyltransferase/squalene oxidase repeat-containing protein [Planctomycetia bacterium]